MHFEKLFKLGFLFYSVKLYMESSGGLSLSRFTKAGFAQRIYKTESGNGRIGVRDISKNGVEGSKFRIIEMGRYPSQGNKKSYVNRKL